MKKTIFFLAALTAFLFICCGPSAEEMSSKEKAKTDSISAVQYSGESDIADEPSSNRDYQNSQSPTDEESNGDKKDAAGKSEQNEGAANKPSAAKQKSNHQTFKANPEQKRYFDSVYVAINSNRKLIKTANMVFKVKDVEKATIKIEQIAYVYGGFVLKSDIKNTVIQANTKRINSDSVLEVGTKRIENNMVLRVPHFFLDSVLFEFANLWIELNERTVNAKDVTIDYLANDLRAKIYQKASMNLNKASQNPGNKLDDIVDAETQATAYLETTVQKQVENLTLQDQVDYATITLNMSQDEIKYEKKMASYELKGFEPGFGSDFVDAISYGWKIILGFILFIAKGWSVILISIGIFLIIYYSIKFIIKKKSKKTEVKP